MAQCQGAHSRSVTPNPKNSSMKFSIRDLLWLMTLAAVLAAWGVDHWIASQERAGLMDALNDEHEKVNLYKGIRP